MVFPAHDPDFVQIFCVVPVDFFSIVLFCCFHVRPSFRFEFRSWNGRGKKMDHPQLPRTWTLDSSSQTMAITHTHTHTQKNSVEEAKKRAATATDADATLGRRIRRTKKGTESMTPFNATMRSFLLFYFQFFSFFFNSQPPRWKMPSKTRRLIASALIFFQLKRKNWKETLDSLGESH